MIDLHTHILPGVDHGACDPEMSLQMLRMEQKQGVHTVALTSHFYCDQESPREFLARRKAAWETLQEAVKQAEEPMPKLILGAEVAWAPGMDHWQELPDLCYEGSGCLLVELPYAPWNEELFRQLYNLMNRTGLTPVIAHVDRYFRNQKKAQLEELLEMGLPMQLSADSLLNPMDRGKALHLLRRQSLALISDSHNTKERRPNVGDALKWLKKKQGEEFVSRLVAETEELL